MSRDRFFFLPSRLLFVNPLFFSDDETKKRQAVEDYTDDSHGPRREHDTANDPSIEYR